MNKLLLVILGLVAVVSLSACNTMRGIGQDVQKAGSAIEDAAKKK
jgi:predicted small secreted protein